jgi:outer membrane immunogenic protein
MKKLLLASTALVAFAAAGTASAADLPVKAPPAPVVCPECNWNGFYFGVNAGGSIGVFSNADAISGFPTFAGFPATGNPFLSSSDKRALPGFMGGAQVGWNFQPAGSHVVFGVEADWDFSSERSTLIVQGQNIAATLFTINYTDQERIRDLGTFRGRIGWAHDSYLWYVTGGGAWARIDSDYTLGSSFPVTTFPSGTSESFRTTKGGWTIGAGVETCLWGSGWSAKLEYLYVNLGTITNTFQTVPTAAGTFSTFASENKIEDHIIRVGLNYRFGGPVVARY